LQKTKKAAVPRPLTPTQATQAMKQGLMTELRETKHIREQMIKPDRDFDMTDVRSVAREGAVRRPGEWNTKYGNFTYRMEGKDAEGRLLDIVFVPGRDHVKLITGVRP
jgi:hypothetical protein